MSRGPERYREGKTKSHGKQRDTHTNTHTEKGEAKILGKKMKLIEKASETERRGRIEKQRGGDKHRNRHREIETAKRRDGKTARYRKCKPESWIDRETLRWNREY